MRNAMLGVSLVLLTMAFAARAADAPQGTDTTHAAHVPDAATTTHAANTGAHAAYPHPVVPSEPSPWAGVVLILILGMFAAAAVVGPVVRYHAPEEPPEPSSHDEHGHDAHGHGH